MKRDAAARLRRRTDPQAWAYVLGPQKIYNRVSFKGDAKDDYKGSIM